MLSPKALSEFYTLEQRNARSDEEMQRADEAALREAIARSLQERAFDVLLEPTRGVEVVPASYAPQRDATHAPRGDATNTVDHVARIEGQQPTEVAEPERERQMSAFADLHPAFCEHLRSHGLKVISNPGKGNSCAIYALVQQVRPDLLPAALDSEVKILRTQYDQRCPADKDKMLYLDAGPGGAADTLIALINERYGVNVQFGVVEAGVEPAHPVTRQGVFPPQASGASFSHRLVVWDEKGHFEAVTGEEELAPRRARG